MRRNTAAPIDALRIAPYGLISTIAVEYRYTDGILELLPCHRPKPSCFRTGSYGKAKWELRREVFCISLRCAHNLRLTAHCHQTHTMRWPRRIFDSHQSAQPVRLALFPNSRRDQNRPHDTNVPTRWGCIFRVTDHHLATQSIELQYPACNSWMCGRKCRQHLICCVGFRSLRVFPKFWHIHEQRRYRSPSQVQDRQRLTLMQGHHRFRALL